MPHRLPPLALPTAAAVATTVAPEPVPDQAFVGPAWSPTALRHLRQSAAWLDAVRPVMRLKIRRWLQFRLRKKIGRDADGRSFRTIDPPLVYERRVDLASPAALLAAAHSRVAASAALAGRSRLAMSLALGGPPAASLPAGNNLAEDFDICVRSVVGRTLNAMQKGTLHCLFSPTNKEKKVRVVQPTGSGKSLVIMSVGLLLCGVHLIVHPLLVLTADQVASFSWCSSEFGTVVVINLDDQAASSASFLNQIIHLVLNLPLNTSATVFLFGSPHFLATQPKFTRAMFECRKAGLLRSIVLDEVDLLARHAASFRAVIRKVAMTFLKPILSMPAQPADRPFHVQLTATLSTEDELSADELVGVSFPGDYTHRASWRAFSRETIVMRYSVSSDNVRHLDPVVTHLQSSPDAAAFVFGNTRGVAKSAATNMEAKLDEAGSAVDVVLVDGNTSRHDKFCKINLFCRRKMIVGYHPNVLSTTAASDQGVDHPNAQYVLNLGWPDLIATWTQRMGRASRAGQAAVAAIVAGITAYVYLVRRSIEASNTMANVDDDADDLTSMNMVIESPWKNSNKELQDIEKKYALNANQKASLMRKQLKDLLDVLRLFCLNLGCQHRRMQRYLATGGLDTAFYLIHPCSSACPVCTNEWGKYFRPLWKDGVVSFFDNIGEFPCDATYDKLMSLVSTSKYWTQAIFDVKCSTLCKYHYEAMYLQLIAAGLIRAETWRGNLSWVICREESTADMMFPPFCYRDSNNWKGISLVRTSKKRAFTCDSTVN